MKTIRLNLDWACVNAGERVCVAISGGADSTALLLAMRDGAAEAGVVLSAAHVHHGLRGDQADADEAFVVALCERLGVGLQRFHVDTAARQAAEREGLEEAARELRYEALRGLLGGSGREAVADVVMTAHTLDDQAETVIMKLLRGAWTEGLAGISPVVAAASGRFVRPLLRVRRSEIEAWLRQKGQSWREDSSNADLSLMRNRVRHELMPMLRSFNPGVDAALARTSDLARGEEQFWAAEVSRVVAQVLLPGRPVRGGGRAVSTAAGEVTAAVDILRVAPLAPAMQRRVLRAVARDVGSRLSADETAKVMAMAGLERHPEVTGRIGSRLELAGGLRVQRSAREIQFWRDTHGTGSL